MSQQLQFPEPVPGTINPAAAARAKTAGMARAAAATRPDWATACRDAIQVMARRGVVFQAADLIAEGLIDEPEHPSQWGPAFGAAAKAGLIEAAGTAPSKRATVHRSLCRTWRGTRRTA
ncbi:hypothetical protein U9R90_05430 [Streptomyces sp. E11-3]|uniref:hypothetical protein n=1 Tax=Streptomyces sp. E11-3 TaxID=3110112 RepID=UPI0039802AE1